MVILSFNVNLTGWKQPKKNLPKIKYQKVLLNLVDKKQITPKLAGIVSGSRISGESKNRRNLVVA